MFVLFALLLLALLLLGRPLSAKCLPLQLFALLQFALQLLSPAPLLLARVLADTVCATTGCQLPLVEPLLSELSLFVLFPRAMLLLVPPALLQLVAACATAVVCATRCLHCCWQVSTTAARFFQEVMAAARSTGKSAGYGLRPVLFSWVSLCVSDDIANCLVHPV